MRDLLRRRMFIVNQRTGVILSAESLFARMGWSWPGIATFQKWTLPEIRALRTDDFTEVQVNSLLELIRKQDGLAKWIEKKVVDTLKPKAEYLLGILRQAPYQTPPPFEKLIGDLEGAYSRRINVQHRLVYQILPKERVVKVIRMWTHYE